jgi:hypothetical protein
MGALCMGLMVISFSSPPTLARLACFIWSRTGMGVSELAAGARGTPERRSQLLRYPQ